MPAQRKKRRKDCVYGMHFDFHANPRQFNIGAGTSAEDLDALLHEVKPDYVQCDTKGHPGLSSYPTKAGIRANLAPGVDRLKIWREVTEKNGVALYGHISSLWDEATAAEHPEWAVRDENGNVSKSVMSVFGPYLRERFIPQLKELAVDYRLDGVWIDGESWTAVPDYSEWAENAYKARCGKPLPKSGDPDYADFIDFLREGMFDFIKTYCDEVHKAAPDFEICSNCLYFDSFERRDLPVDFVSADCGDSSYIRLAVRMMQKSGKPWDMMSWFEYCVGTFDVCDMDSTLFEAREQNQLMQEAALSLSQGGGYEFCHGIFDRTTSWAVPVYKALGEFCRRRERFCFNAKPVHSAGLFASYARENTTPNPEHGNHIFSTGSNNNYALKAVLDIMLGCGLSTEIVFPEENLSAYKLIVLPNCVAVTEREKRSLLDYAKNGGRLLLTGCDTINNFSKELGIKAEPVNGSFGYLLHGTALVAITVPFGRVSGNMRRDGEIYLNKFLEGEPLPAAFSIPYGKGEIRGIPIDFTLEHRNPIWGLERFFEDTVRKMKIDAGVEVEGSSFVEVSLTEKDGNTCVNLVNTLGGSSAVRKVTEALAKPAGTANEIPPLYGITVKVSMPEKPASVWLEPEHKALDFRYEDGKVIFTADRLEIHSVAVIEPQGKRR